MKRFYFINLFFFALLPTFLLAQRATIDFEEYANGITLSSQSSLTALGISFPEGLEVVDCQFSGLCDAGADGAYSGTKAAIGAMVTEFTREPIIINFEDPQDSVIIYLKPAYTHLTMQVSIQGWLEGYGSPVSGGTVTFNNNSFNRYKLTSCDEVRIYAASGSSGNDNWLIIDDINFMQAEEVIPDETAPNVYLYSPSSDYESTDGSIPLDGIASDNEQLDTVEVYVYNSEGVLYESNFCGRAGVACPLGTGNYEFTTDFDFSAWENGDYTIGVRAIDASGNEATYERDFTLNIPPPPPPVHVEKIEVNQAVQDVLFDVDGPGTASTASSTTPLLPERPTLVRYYLSVPEGVRYDYSAYLKVTVFHEDGSSSSENVYANMNGFPDVDSVVPYPTGAVDEIHHLVDMRANLGKTLNFVIDGDILTDADIVGLTLFEGITPVSGQLQVNFWTGTELGINYYRVKSDAPTPTVIMDNIGDYIYGTYPISRLHQNYERDIIITLGFNLWAELFNFSEASRYRRSLKSAIDGRYPPLSYSPEYNHWRVILGVMDPFAGGNATRGSANDNGDRYYGVASTSSRGNVGAHETGHLIGLKHAGKAHGECGGGGCEEIPNTNGTLDGTNHYRSDFGIALKYNDGASLYDAFLIDPCPGASPEDRVGGCPAAAIDTDPEPIRPFDMMSYGEPVPWGGFILDTRSRQWISTHNYRRIYHAIQNRTSLKEATETTVSDSIHNYFQLDGVIKEDSAYLYPMLVKPMGENIALDAMQTEGDFQVSMFDIAGEELHSQYFKADTIEDLDECCALNFNVILPYFNNLNKVIIYDSEGNVMRERIASPAAPSINLISDLGGEDFDEGTFTVAWEVTDADSDPHVVLIEYSPDMGETWQPLAYLEEPENGEVTISVDDLTESDQAVIKVSVSDGLNTDFDYTKETFCVKTSGNCESQTVDLDDDGVLSIVSPEDFVHPVNAYLFPNPTQNQVNLVLDVPYSERINIEIIDMVGNTIQIAQNTYSVETGRNTIVLDVRDLVSGVYFVNIQVGGELLTKRLTRL